MKALQIYKASAGSGKTFTLAVEYIKLLIGNPYAYRHILAVTFTNKATAEMKIRILGQLNGIAHGLKNSEGYFQKLLEDEQIRALKLSEAEVRRRAGMALSNLLHDYHRFRVVTIDSFFQSIVRELAYELDLTANLRVDLKAKEALAEAVKTLIDDLGNARTDKEQRKVLALIFEFVKERIDDGQSWQIAESLSSFGMHIFNEQYLKQNKADRQAMGDAQRLKAFKATLRKRRDDDVDQVKRTVGTIWQELRKNGLDESTLKGKSRGVAGLLNRLLLMTAKSDTSKVLGTAWKKYCTSGAEWTSDKAQQAWAQATVVPMLGDVVATLQDLNTCCVVMENLNEMMLLNAINDKLRQQNLDANRFLLADTGHFLRSLIDESDVPFIYERTGTRFHHIMIDEFQDTSELQWDNFRPLLHNSLSQLHRCLIVGDVKQSIYRWRNSDWSIFNGIEQSEFATYINSVSLQRNFRSAERVVAFNNAVFRGAVGVVQTYHESLFGTRSADIDVAYQDVAQLVSEKKRGQGFVRIDNVVAQPDETDTECTLRALQLNLAELLEAGVPQNKITILVRTGKQGEQIVRHLEQTMPQVKVVSNEAYTLEASHALQLLVQALRVLNEPHDRLQLCQLMLSYQRDILNRTVEDDWVNTLFSKANEDSDVLLPAAFAEAQRTELSRMPLYELCERLYAIFGLSTVAGQDAYLYCFYEKLLAYLQEKTATLAGFLDYWDAELCKQQVQMGNVDGLQIMTIHKSKGLEFHTVIAPFFEWRADGLDSKKARNYVWCRPAEAPFDEVPIMPIHYSQKLSMTAFSEDYKAEVLRQLVDNLNLMYVAFTRAEQHLVVITRSKPESGKTKQEFSPTLDQILRSALKAFPEIEEAPTMRTEELANDHSPGMRYETGVMGYVAEVAKTDDDGNLLTQQPASLIQPFYHEPLAATFVQSNESLRFTAPLDERTADEEAHSYVMMGNIVHHILEHVEHADELGAALHRADCDGLFADEAQRREVETLLTTALQTSEAAEWFAPHWRVMNECRILYKNEEGALKTCRPDRVITDGVRTIVIDYKTTHSAPSAALRKAYQKQVAEYVQHLGEMGYGDVEGYVWYVAQGVVERV